MGCALRPVVGVLCCNEMHERPIQAVATRFIRPLASISDAVVLLVPSVVDACDILAIAGRLDGLLLTGSRSNVAPARYGADDGAGPLDEARDDVALSLAGRMIEAGKPVFGICRGLQELNVLFGGTLTGTLEAGAHHAGTPETDEHDAQDYAALFDHRHAVTLASQGLLGRASPVARLAVNSVHHQGIDRLGSGLTVEAVADDGLVEAISARPCGADVLAVQWHPEWDVGNNPTSRAFFDTIGGALRG